MLQRAAIKPSQPSTDADILIPLKSSRITNRVSNFFIFFVVPLELREPGVAGTPLCARSNLCWALITSADLILNCRSNNHPVPGENT